MKDSIPVPPGSNTNKAAEPSTQTPSPQAGQGQSGMEEYLDDFLTEFAQTLDSMKAALDKLEINPGDKAELYTLYRNAHNIKGGARAMGFIRLGEFFRRIELSLAPFRDNGKPLPEILTKAIRMAWDSLQAAPETIKKLRSDSALDFGPASQKLDSATNLYIRKPD